MINNDKKNIITIGTFDGVHLGHQKKKKAIAYAKTTKKQA